MIPFHEERIYYPNGHVEAIRTYPAGQAFNRCGRPMKGYCKYCYTTHRNWWEMSEADYGRTDIVLCGECGYTSIKEYTQ